MKEKGNKNGSGGGSNLQARQAESECLRKNGVSTDNYGGEGK